VTGPKQRHYESAQEEFQRRVKELYELAEKMGLRLAISVKKKSSTPPPQPFTKDVQGKREPGEN
jgi:hypothetical protein